MLQRLLINLMPGFLVKAFAKPYVTGNSIDRGIIEADRLWNKSHISSTLDLLGETVYTRKDVENNISTYISLVHKLEDRKYATISIKPSALGSHESYEYCLESLEKICAVASEASIPLTIDMEDYTSTDMTLKLYNTLIKKYTNLGTVLQSRLFRTEKDLENLPIGKSRIRMCIGIYNETEDIALTKKREMKDELFRLSIKLLENKQFVEYATHDIEYIDKMLDYCNKNSITSDRIEFQQLMGVPLKKTQRRILNNGFAVRLYLPFATHWNLAIPYLKRRLINNPKMAIYVIKNLFTFN